jgi:3D (Asp-Asp-Asp) domain-containing protein
LRPAEIRSLLSTVFTVSAAIVFSSCQSTGRSARVLPAYEAPLARSDFQNVRMTAYTHTEADHTQYGARNALGGQLHAAGPAIRRAENVARAVPAEFDAQLDYQRVAYSGAPRQPFAMEETTATATSTTTTARTRTARSTKSVHGAKRAIAVAKKTPKIGSAAADWSRWPAGTTFRLLSTGQIYCVDDYGWALSGRNTIDLYMATPREMNSWGARQEPIQILKWGDPVQSMRLLAPRQGYKHIHRMVLELEGRDQAAAGLQ